LAEKQLSEEDVKQTNEELKPMCMKTLARCSAKLFDLYLRAGDSDKQDRILLSTTDNIQMRRKDIQQIGLRNKNLLPDEDLRNLYEGAAVYDT
jgi:hypothetical protein